MSTSAPFEVTPEAFEVVASLLRQQPEMQAGLIVIPSFEVFDEKGTFEARDFMFEGQKFLVAA